jgi:GNAT superfamily N-acetyltransferase
MAGSITNVHRIERVARSRFASGDVREVDYALRLAPYNIARIRVERIGPHLARVHWVFVPPAYRGQGLGGDLLAEVIRDADRDRRTLTLVAKACGTMAQRPLERWYESYGFRGRLRDHEGGLEMARRPAIEKAASRRLRVA